MPLDGLRAWIGEVERKLGMRTRVFLVLAVIAVGGAGAAIFLAVDAQDSSVSEGDVQALQEKLEARIGEGTSATGASQLEAEVKALQAQVKELQEGGGGSGNANSGSSGGGSSGGTSGGSSGTADGVSSGDSSSGASNEGTGDTGSGGSNLQEILRRAREQQE